MNERRSLSPKEYAQRHGVSTRTVFRWIKAGRLNVLRMSKRTIRIIGVSRRIADDDSYGQDRTAPPQ